MLERVSGAIQSRILCVPETEHAVDLGAADHPDLLATLHHGGSKLFVQTGFELYLLRRQLGLSAPQLEVDAAQRRAAIAGDEAGGVQPAVLVAPALLNQQTH